MRNPQPSTILLGLPFETKPDGDLRSLEAVFILACRQVLDRRSARRVKDPRSSRAVLQSIVGLAIRY
jgi:hypothetical protein